MTIRWVVQKVTDGNKGVGAVVVGDGQGDASGNLL